MASFNQMLRPTSLSRYDRDRVQAQFDRLVKAGAIEGRSELQFRSMGGAFPNAFALPGGIVFVTRGTLETVRDEGELAGVLAHEISHVALRHGTSQMSKAYVAEQGIGILGTVFGGGSERPSDAGDMATAVGGIGLNTLFLKFSRECETEADLAGARMLSEVGSCPFTS